MRIPEAAARAGLAGAIEDFRSQPADRREAALSPLADRVAALRARTADLSEVTLEVEDAIGDECVRFTRDLERRLGHAVGERTLKPEYHDEPPREAEAEEEGGA